MAWTVYMHKFPNRKVYIGITSQSTYRRWRNNGNGYISQQLMYKAIQKYGWNNIEHIILFSNLDEKTAKEKEQELIAKYNSNNINYGYNLTKGGDGVVGYICKNETREKLSKVWLGKHHSEYTKKLISEKMKGHKVSDKALLALENTRKKLTKSGALKHPHKMTNKGRLAQRKNTSTPLVQYNENKVPIALWESGTLVKELLNINPYNASKNFNLKAGGFYWKRCKDTSLNENVQIVFMNLKVYMYENMKGEVA